MNSLFFGPFRLTPAARTLLVNDLTVAIGSRALDILIVLTEKPGEIIPHRELFARVWPSVVVEEANLRVHVAALRKALGDGRDGARYIANVPGRGYSFVADVTSNVDVDADSGAVDVKTEPISERVVVCTAPGNHLPQPLARIVGREGAVASIVDQLTQHRFVSIVGAGGMGKTTVAISVAHALLEDFNGQAVFVDLATLTDPGLVATAVVSAIGLPLQAQDPVPGLLAHLADKRMLLILDNCEHVIESAALLAERLHAETEELHLLTTSRESLRVEGEVIHWLRPLDGPPEMHELTAAQALKAPAVRLFMERAEASGHLGALSDADAVAVADICHKLDGLPLALELAAGRVGSHGIQGTTDLLNNRFRLLWQGRRSALPRHQTLHAMLDWSFNLLADADRQVFRRLAVFVGPFTIEAATHVAGAEDLDPFQVADTLNSLVDKSLIWSANSSGSALFRLPDTTRSYLALKLTESNETASTARRHALYFGALLDAEASDRTIVDVEQMVAASIQIGNIRSALEWSFSSDGDASIAVDLAVKAAPVFLALPLLPECLLWCRRGLPLLPVADQGTRKELILQQAIAMCAMFSQGNGDTVRVAIERGLELAEALDAPRQRLHLLAGLHIYHSRIGAFQRALEVALDSLVVASKLDDPAAQIVANWMVGCSYHLVGDQEKAQRHCEAGFELASSRADIKVTYFGYDHRVRALIVMARTLWLRGHPARGEQFGRMAIAEAELRGHPVSLCIALIYTISVLLWGGSLVAAEPLIDRLVRHAERYGLGPYHAVGIAMRGELLVATGQPAAGAELLRGALATLQTEHHILLASGTVRALADALTATGEVEEAVELLDADLENFHRARDNRTFDIADLLRARAQTELARQSPDLDRAETTLNLSLSLARTQSAVFWELRTTIDLARLISERGEHLRARELLEIALAKIDGGAETLDQVIAVDLLGHIESKGRSRLLHIGTKSAA